MTWLIWTIIGAVSAFSAGLFRKAFLGTEDKDHLIQKIIGSIVASLGVILLV